MAGERTIKIKFTGDTSGLDKAASGAEQSMGRWKASTIALGSSAGIALERAGRAVFEFTKDSIAEFAAAEEAQGRLTDAFARFPSIADTNIATLRGINEELQRKTKFDDDALASGQAVLAQFGLTGKQLEEITPLLADFAAKTGQDVPGAAEQLGKAFLGQGRALKAVGIDFQDTGDLATNITAVMDGLRTQVGGFAEQQGKTAAGQAAILTNQFGELKEQLGRELLPVMLKAAEVGLKVVDWIDKNRAIVLPLIAVIAAVTIAQIAWNIAMTANPIGLIIVAVAALVAAIVWLATKTTFFQDLWGTVWGFVKRSFENWVNFFKAAIDFVSEKWTAIVRGFATIFATVFNKIADIWNGTIGKLSWTVPSWVPFIGGNTISAPKLPHLAVFHQGGIVPGPTGSEMLSVLQAGEIIIPRGGGDGGMEIRVWIGDREITDIVRAEVVDVNRGIRRNVLAGAGAR